MKWMPLLLVLLTFCACQPTAKEEPTPVAPAPLEAPSYPQLKPDRFNVALLVIDGTFNSELTAPMDIFHHTEFREGIRKMNVFTVSNTLEPVTTFEGLRILPDFNFLDTVPPIDILVIPAGEHNLDTDLENTALIEFIRNTSEKAQYVCSHCDGAFLLAQTGLLNGHRSTTFPGDVAAYRERFPQLEVLDNQLWVHSGKFITSAGGARSFEASLYLAELLYGKKVADELAEGMVIDWDLNALPFDSEGGE